MQGESAAGEASTAAKQAEAGWIMPLRPRRLLQRKSRRLRRPRLLREQAMDASPEAAGGQAGGSLATGAEEQQQEVPLQAVEEAISGPGDSRTQHVRSHEDTVVAASSVLPA